VSLSLDQSRTSSTSTGIPSPPAVRARRRSWRDPRLAVGVLLVTGSVLAGAQVLASSDDTVAVLTARGPLAAGQQVHADDLSTVRLRFSSEADADRYLPADAEVDGVVLQRPVGPGELVPRAALGAASAGR
jgi:flagella basal body P-ring formation protein FlgA